MQVWFLPSCHTAPKLLPCQTSRATRWDRSLPLTCNTCTLSQTLPRNLKPLMNPWELPFGRTQDLVALCAVHKFLSSSEGQEMIQAQKTKAGTFHGASNVYRVLASKLVQNLADEFPKSTKNTCVEWMFCTWHQRAEEWVFTLIAVNGYLSAISLPVNAWWTGPELKQLDSAPALTWMPLDQLGMPPTILLPSCMQTLNDMVTCITTLHISIGFHTNTYMPIPGCIRT